MSSCLEKLELAFFAAFRAGIILLFKGLPSVFILPLDGMCTTRHHLTPRYSEAPVVRRVQEYKRVKQNPKSRLQTASPVAVALEIAEEWEESVQREMPAASAVARRVTKM